MPRIIPYQSLTQPRDQTGDSAPPATITRDMWAGSTDMPRPRIKTIRSDLVQVIEPTVIAAAGVTFGWQGAESVPSFVLARSRGVPLGAVTDSVTIEPSLVAEDAELLVLADLGPMLLRN